MAETYANLFRTTVGAGGITNAALSLPVAAAAPLRFCGFEARCLVGTAAQLGDGSAEIMLATIPADGLGPWVVAREVEPEGRPAVAHVAGEEVALGALTSGGLAGLTRLELNAQAASYTLVLADAGRVVEVASASASTVTVPPNSGVAFPVGTVLEVARMGAGTVSVAAGVGVTIRSRSGLLGIGAQYAAASLRKRAADEWVLIGDLV